MQNIILLFGIFVIGWLAGVLVNYLSDVLPWKRRLHKPICVNCQASFPLVNYFVWPRRCVQCDERRHWRVWIVEVVLGLAALWVWMNPHAYWGFWLSLVVLVYFGVVIVIDLEYRLILHQVSLAGVAMMSVLGVMWRLLQYAERTGVSWFSGEAWWHAIWTTLLGGAVGFGLMWVLYALGEVFVRLLAKWRGKAINDVALGFGDVNLSGVLGLLLGWPLIVLGLFLAVFIGGFISLLFIVGMLVSRRYQMFAALPYGPFLVLGAIIVIFFQNMLVRFIP